MKANKMLMIAYIYREGRKLKIETRYIEDELNSYYELLHCKTIDIVRRKINGITYSFVVDDEYLITHNDIDLPVAVFEGEGEEAIFARLVITGDCDQEGNLTSLNPKDIKRIEKSTDYFRFQANEYPNLYPIFKALKYNC